MANIKPISDLRNYNTVLKDCVAGAPVYLTKNGRGRFVLLDIAEYEQDQAEKALFARIAEAETRVQNGEATLTLDELKAKLGI
ncbi:MAG: type II toxin-antitoxin system prevent-host-death family antitoxin [Clostridiales bacterium]|jgi:prevent-host-death family protein|nr:type II toxin-antitoxin system prevent-host-death family antitoxin [Clostridiales bacterium]